ncbi:PREDICTED: disease resistance protein TAO1-like [Tarenaya hassleriana]|uniref:disease resistance protein TAO1-like n=1 Tax=Tarenaya hassleriana TaxID=28532 RepID=UPI00053C9E85|nr:PREDICTED: disease resistance protein TAO1-like [Tarenaya hassleriana]
MASPSSHHDVFISFTGRDVRRTFLSHLRKEFRVKGISCFEDDRIERSRSIGPELVRAIKESMVSVVVISKNYASSSWCLDELSEIMKRREEDEGHYKVMTVFYEVDPYDVRKQAGDFGEEFERTCVGSSMENIRRWKEALSEVANIAGEHSRNWDNEAEMIEKIVVDISSDLSSTSAEDVDDIRIMESHTGPMARLLRLESEEVRFVGIWGPAGIGKTTLARALFSRHSSNFQLSLFVENVKRDYKKTDFDDYGLKLYLKEQLLSKMFDLKDIGMNHHMGVGMERLKSKKILLVLDDIDDAKQLDDALASHTRWLGPGSRVIVTTKDVKLLRSHNIDRIYNVDFPSKDKAIQIFSRYAFGQNSPPDGFRDLVTEVVSLAGYLPLGLGVLGSSLRGMVKEDWLLALPRLRSSLDKKIEKTLQVSYHDLHDKDKSIFLHISCLFNGEHVDRISQLLANSDLDIDFGLKVLADRSLIRISTYGRIVMHCLLEQMGREIVRRQSIHGPGKRQFLVDPKEIYDVFSDNTGTGNVLGISLDASRLPDKLFISQKIFLRFPNLQFLRFCNSSMDDGERMLRFSGGLDYLSRKLRLLHWDAFPMATMPRGFRPEFLVELNLRGSKLQKLWDGRQPLRNLKEMDLSYSRSLREIPDLSNATNLEKLYLDCCESLIALPSSIGELNKLTRLSMEGCINFEAFPDNVDLESLSILDLNRCSRLRSFPEISTNIEHLRLNNTAIDEIPSSIRQWSRLFEFSMNDCGQLKMFPHVPHSVRFLFLSKTGIEEVPPWIENLSRLKLLEMGYCKNLKRISSNISNLEHLERLVFSGSRNIASVHTEIFKNSCFSNTPRLGVAKIHVTSLTRLSLANSDFVSIPDYIKHLCHLHALFLDNCRRLTSLPDLPDSLCTLRAFGCVSLEKVSRPFSNPGITLNFINCLNLNQESQRFVQESVCMHAFLPVGKVFGYFPHWASGSSLTIRYEKRLFPEFLRFKACVVLAAETISETSLSKTIVISYRAVARGAAVRTYEFPDVLVHVHTLLTTDHLCMFSSYVWLDDIDRDGGTQEAVTDSEILLEFSCTPYKVKGCGLQILNASCRSSDTLDTCL